MKGINNFTKHPSNKDDKCVGVFKNREHKRKKREKKKKRKEEKEKRRKREKKSVKRGDVKL